MKLLLLDGNSLTYRAFFALPQDMSTASGQLTNAVFGFTSMFINVLKEQRPDAVLVAFDRPEPTFRHHADVDYKANRDAAPDSLRQQMGLVREVLSALGVATCELSGWEADDLIATAAEQAVERGDDVVIVTGDRDVYQLVKDPHVKVLYNRRGVSDYALYDEAGIVERTGVTPAQYPEYAALRGDPSDNLPGVPGVGEKTAAKLIVKYGGLDADLRARRRADPEAARVPRRVRGPGAQEPRDLDPPPRRADRAARVADDQPERRGGQAAVRVPRVPHARRPPDRGPRPGCAGVVGRGPPAARRRGDRQRVAGRVGGVARLAAGPRPRRGVGGRGRPHAARRDGRRHGRRVGRRDLDPRRPPRRRRRRGRARWRHRARPRRQGVDAHAARARHRSARPRARHRHRRLSARPGRGPLRAAAADRALYPLRRPGRRAGGEGSARPRRHHGRTVGDRRAPGAGRAPPRRPDPQQPRRAGHGRAVRHRREPPRARAGPHGAGRDRRRRRRAQSAQRAPDGGGQAPRGRAARGRRARRRQRQLADPAARDPLRRPAGRSRPDADQEDQDRRLDRRGDAREAARPVAGVHRPAAAVPRGREAAGNVRRGPPGRGRRRTGGSTPRSTRRWPAPAGSARTGPTCTTSRSAGRRDGSSARRSSPRPDARSSSPTTTRSSCG